MLNIQKSLYTIIQEVWIFVKNDFHLPAYLYAFTIATIGIVVRYNTDFYDRACIWGFNNDSLWWMNILFYTTVYLLTAIPTLLMRGHGHTLHNLHFWIKSLVCIIIYAVYTGYIGHWKWNFSTLSYQEQYYLKLIIGQSKGIVLMLLPLALLKVVYDRHEPGLYGLRCSSKLLDGYMALYLMLLPFLIGISFTSDFLQAYPQFRLWNFDHMFGWPTWLVGISYEVPYAFDFIMTEVLFRGALVIGMAALLGRDAVLPMIVMYVSIHFGKPWMETYSSLFGGYILGALAYQTRHIWGGVIVHMGIAITMEIMGFIQYYCGWR